MVVVLPCLFRTLRTPWIPKSNMNCRALAFRQLSLACCFSFFSLVRRSRYFLNLLPQGLGPSSHSTNDLPGNVRHRAQAHMVKCEIGGRSGTCTIIVIHCVDVDGCKKGVLTFDSSLPFASPWQAFFGPLPSFGLPKLELEYLFFYQFLICPLHLHECITVSFVRDR